MTTISFGAVRASFQTATIAAAILALSTFNSVSAGAAERGDVKALVTEHARLHGLPETLAHRIVLRESKYNAHLIGRGHYGLMQISLPTARSMGYRGAPAGLLDPATNLTFAMPYLANAWIVAGRDENRAVSLYSRGYYYEAKRKGLLREMRSGRTATAQTATSER